LVKASDNSAAAKTFQASLNTLKNTAKEFSEITKKLDKLTETVLKEFAKNDIVAAKYQTAATNINAALLGLDRRFVYEPGLDNRSFYKHVINARKCTAYSTIYLHFTDALFLANRHDGYYTVLMPGIVESIEDKNWVKGNRW